MTSRGPAIALVALATVALAVGACSSTQPPAPSSSPSPSPLPSAPIESVIPASLIVIDASLLEVLPSEVDGQQLVESPEAEAAALTDLELGQNVERLATGLVADPAAEDWAIATVSALRPGTWTESFDRDWRDSYDEGVCEQAGGVTGNAQTVIAGRLVRIGTCANGVHTYHVRLPEDDLLVSVTSIGEGRFGERLIEGLRPPG